MIIRQTTTIVFEYPQDYLQEQEWCKTKEDRWIHKGTDTLGAVYENQISYSIGVSADRKTENSSEKPNNCEECKHWNDTEDGCADRHGCRTTTEDWQDWKDLMWAEAIVTEPTTEDSSTVPTSSKMEQVQPQTDCNGCKFVGWYDTEFPCVNCIRKNKDYYTSEQTERSE